MVFLTNLTQLVVIGYPAIKVNGHHTSGLGGDVLFYLVDIKFEMPKVGSTRIGTKWLSVMARMVAI